ncbi:S1 family peptidase, partial [Photobacterium sanctipauli]
MVKLLFILLSLSMFLPVQASEEIPVPSPRVIGGIQSEANELPWQAYLNMTFPDSGGGSSTYICGGVVISPTVVLTAAHCLYNGSTLVLPQNLEVWAGITSIFSANSANAILVDSFVVHPSYNSSRFANDI